MAGSMAHFALGALRMREIRPDRDDPFTATLPRARCC
jgi:hypothetical protein